MNFSIEKFGEGVFYGGLVGPGAGAGIGYLRTKNLMTVAGALVSRPIINALNGMLGSVGGATGFGGAMGW